MSRAFPPIAELLPHTGRAILVDAVSAHTDSTTTATVTITPAHAYFENGHGVPAWVGIEMMAQVIAAHGALEARAHDDTRPRQGMLLGTRHYDGRVAWFAEGARLDVHIERSFGHNGGGMAACDCRIEQAGRVLATATVIIVEQEVLP
ncbi:MAG TPA: 3-hydroxylacyl-ACP dehydratase [Rhodanobacteraceae bacterium]